MCVQLLWQGQRINSLFTEVQRQFAVFSEFIFRHRFSCRFQPARQQEGCGRCLSRMSSEFYATVVVEHVLISPVATPSSRLNDHDSEQ